MQCPKCQETNPILATFCQQCGEPLLPLLILAALRSPVMIGVALAGLALGMLMGIVPVIATAILPSPTPVTMSIATPALTSTSVKGAIPTDTPIPPLPASVTATLAPPTNTPPQPPTLPPPPTSTPKPLPTNTPPPTSTRAPPPQPVDRRFAIDFKGCVGGTPKGTGVVKGQVLDRQGRPLTNARVGINLQGSWWQDSANPARVNEAGWYEFYLTPGQRVNFVLLRMPNGTNASFSPFGYQVQSTGGCFQHVNFIEQ